jgi:adenylate kinase
LKIDVVLNLHLRQDILIRKLLGRRVCPSCKKSFNVEDVNEDDYRMPPMLPQNHDPSTCDDCLNTKLITRKDDTREVIVKRQKIYEDEMHDIISYFES